MTKSSGLLATWDCERCLEASPKPVKKVVKTSASSVPTTPVKKPRPKARRKSSALVYVDGNVIRLRDPTGLFYDVELDRMDTIPRLFDYVNHLLKLPWISTEHLREFVEFVSHRKDLDIYEVLL